MLFRSYLQWRASDGKGSDDVAREEVLAEMGGVGVVAAIAGPTLDRLGRHGLVNSLTRPEPPWLQDDAIRLGASGRYYLQTMVHN